MIAQPVLQADCERTTCSLPIERLCCFKGILLPVPGRFGLLLVRSNLRVALFHTSGLLWGGASQGEETGGRMRQRAYRDTQRPNVFTNKNRRQTRVLVSAQQRVKSVGTGFRSTPLACTVHVCTCTSSGTCLHVHKLSDHVSSALFFLVLQSRSFRTSKVKCESPKLASAPST